MAKIKYDDVIRSVSYDKNELLFNILKLYNNGDTFDCDPTYSKGGFYNQSVKYPIPEPKFKFDCFPVEGIDGVEKIQPFGKWSLKNKSIQSICIDLPFVISPVLDYNQIDKKKSIIARRFNSYYPREEMFKSYQWFMMEAYRVLKPNGICVWKTQRTISGGKCLMTPEYSWLIAEQTGFTTLDRFTLIARNRLWSGQIKEQQHSRSFDSQFYVFRKPDGTSKTAPINYRWWEVLPFQK